MHRRLHLPSASSLVYLLALGGDPGLGGGAFYPHLPWPPSAHAPPSPPAASSDAQRDLHHRHCLRAHRPSPTSLPRASPPAPPTSSASPNAFATASSLADYATEKSQAVTATVADRGIVPQAEINALADILSICVNSNGTTGHGSFAPESLRRSHANRKHHPHHHPAGRTQHRPSSRLERHHSLLQPPALTSALPTCPVLPVVYNSLCTGTYTGVPKRLVYRRHLRQQRVE